jgi:hypothetical protein
LARIVLLIIKYGKKEGNKKVELLSSVGLFYYLQAAIDEDITNNYRK